MVPVSRIYGGGGILGLCGSGDPLGCFRKYLRIGSLQFPHRSAETLPTNTWEPEISRKGATLKTILTTPTPHICKKDAPKIVWHKSRLTSREFYRKYGIRTQKYGIRTPPFMPYEPFLLGVGVFFNLLKLSCNATFQCYIAVFCLLQRSFW